MARVYLSSFRRLLLPLILIGFGCVPVQASDTYVVVPQLVVGDGWSSDLFITSQDAMQAEDLVLSFFATGSGAPMPVTTNLGLGDTFQFSLEGGESRAIRVTSPDPLQVGYAVLRIPQRVSVRATLFVRWRDGEATVTQLGVPGQDPAYCFSFPVEYDPSKQVSMGVAVVLPVQGTPPASSQNLVVSLIDQAGALVRTSIVNLPPGGHIARMLNEEELFPGLTQFTGNVVVSGIVPFNALALRVEGTVLGSVGVNGGPIVRPFMVGPAIVEVETNDTLPQAMQLTAPARVSSGLRAPGDVDFFHFDGKSGEVITVLTDTRGMSSSADTVLTLLDPDGAVIATNDQNGLLFCDDSFLQTVLTRDGSYAVKVEERGKWGGTFFRYDLHLQTSESESPALTSMTPDTLALGSIVDVTISGTNLAGTRSLQFSDSEGITVTDLDASATQITARFAIWAGAFPGRRTVRAVGGGVSTEVSFTIIPASAPGKTPTISSLEVTAPVFVENWADIHVAFDFADPDGDILWINANPDPNARILFMTTCGDMALTGPVLKKAGQTSGTISFTLRMVGYSTGNYTVNMQLLDAAGNGSNILTFETTAWECQ